MLTLYQIKYKDTASDYNYAYLACVEAEYLPPTDVILEAIKAKHGGEMPGNFRMMQITDEGTVYVKPTVSS